MDKDTDMSRIQVTSTAQALLAQMGGGGAAAAAAACGGAATAFCSFNRSSAQDKVAILGNGQLAVEIIMALIAQKISKEIVLVDKGVNDIRKELEDVADAAMFIGQVNMIFTVDYERCRDARVLVLAYDCPCPENEKNLCTMISTIKEVLPPAVAAAPGSVLLVVTSPSDAFAWLAWRLSGLPPSHVIGLGSVLTSQRFRRVVARRLRLSVSSVAAYVLGRNTFAWGALAACGVRLRDVNPLIGTKDDPEEWDKIGQEILTIKPEEALKSTALATSTIISAIVRDSRECLPVATHVSGCRHTYSPQKDVFLALPCVLGAQGVAYIVRQALTEQEKEFLQQEAEFVNAIQSKFMLD